MHILIGENAIGGTLTKVLEEALAYGIIIPTEQNRGQYSSTHHDICLVAATVTEVSDHQSFLLFETRQYGSLRTGFDQNPPKKSDGKILSKRSQRDILVDWLKKGGKGKTPAGIHLIAYEDQELIFKQNDLSGSRWYVPTPSSNLAQAAA